MDSLRTYGEMLEGIRELYKKWLEELAEIMKNLGEKEAAEKLLKEKERLVREAANYALTSLLQEKSRRLKEIVFTAEIIEKGRITIPKAIRDFYDLKEGDLVTVVIVDVLKTKKKAEELVEELMKIVTTQTTRLKEELTKNIEEERKEEKEEKNYEEWRRRYDSTENYP